ncbi:MAG: exodeoxyribonuclease VII small subunit [Planctomycetota bacterium]
MSSEDDTEGETPGFDASLGRLEELVAELEEGGLGLEDSLARYREGVVLLKGCRERLAGFRAQVEELTAEGLVAHDRDPDLDGRDA